MASTHGLPQTQTHGLSAIIMMVVAVVVVVMMVMVARRTNCKNREKKTLHMHYKWRCLSMLYLPCLRRASGRRGSRGREEGEEKRAAVERNAKMCKTTISLSLSIYL